MNQNNEGTTLFHFARETILQIFYCRNFPLKYRSVSEKFERKLRILVQFKPRYRLQKNIMGQQFSSIQQINRLYQMPLGQYGLKERISSALSLWKRRNPPYQQLIESRMVVNTQRELSEIYDIFKMRHMHQYLPATRYLTCQHHGIKGCGQYYQGNLYFDNAIATLSMINDIPFFDSLHLLSVALKGYQILYKKFGYFDIFEDMFHICENGKVKVWCNSQIHKLRPQQYLLDPSGKEEDMIYRIINMIDENVDKSDKYNLKNQLYAKLRNGTHFQSFDHVNIIFRQLCKEKGWATPERLKCISLLTRQDIQKLLVLQDKINKSQKQIHINQPNLLTLNSFTEATNDAYLKNNFQGKTSLRLPPTQNQQKKNHFQENNSNFSLKNAKSSVINLLNSLPPTNLQNNISSPSLHHPSSPTLRSFPIAPKEPPHYLTMRSNTPQMKFRPRIQTPQSRPTIRMVSVERPTIKIENKTTPFPSFQNNAVLLNRNATTTNITPNYYVQLSPRFNPNTVLNNQIKNQRAMVQNVIRIPVSPRQRNIQTNINPQYIFQPQPQSQPQHQHQPQQQHQNQKFPIHFVHNQNNSVQKQTSLSYLKSTDRNPHLIEQKNKSFKKLDQSFNNLHNRREESKQMKPNNFQYQYKNNSNKSPTPKSIVISDSIYKNNSNSRSNYSKQRQKQIEREIQLNSFKFNSQAHQQTIQSSEIPKFQSIQQFHQRFEQSIISPEQSMRSRPSKRQLSKRQFQFFQQNNKEITDQTRRSKKRLPNIQYTDPHLIQLLSPKRNQKQMNVNETDSNLGNKQSLSKDLYYSFSQTSLNQRQKQLQKLQTLQITQQSSTHTFSNMFDRNLPNYSDLEVINSSPQVSLRDQVTKRKYQIGIDEEIWKDYIKLKKNKNMN